MSKNALTTGIIGQDGAYMAKYLLLKGYNVFGIIEDYRPQTLEITSLMLRYVS